VNGRMCNLIALHEAYQPGDLRALKTLLKNPPDFPNCRGPQAVGEIVLQCAIYHNPVPFVRALLELGADPNYDDSGGFPSMLAASSSGRAERHELVELRLAFGANVLHRGINDYTPLHDAAARNDLQMIKLLLAYGANPTERTRIDDFSTPIEEAERRKFSQAAQVLKESDKVDK